MGITRKKETQRYEFRKDFVAVDGRFPKSIVAKVDWFTAMFYDVSVENLLDLYGLQDFLTADLVAIYSERYSTETNLGKQIILQIAPGIRIEIKCSLIESRLKIFNPMGMEFPDLMCEPLPAIRIDFNGSGLEFLRAGGYDVDSRFTTPFFVCSTDGMVYSQFGDVRCKITRIDIAFDLLNYVNSFYETCVDLIGKYGDYLTGTIHLGEDPKCKAKHSYSIRSGKERTIYLGSSKSNKLCRIYDKGYQWGQARIKSIADHPYQTIDGILPDSWIRIELQLRNGSKNSPCDEILHFSAGDFSKMFSYWYFNFAICSQKGRVCDEFASYFDWSELPLIIQNANYGNIVLTKSDVIGSDLAAIIGRVINAVSNLSWEGFRQLVDSSFDSMQYSNDPSSMRRVSFIKLRSLTDDHVIPPYVEVKNGRWILK